MRAVGIRELKDHLSEYLRQVGTGEHLQVTCRGRVVAELSPPRSPQEDGIPAGLQELFRRGTARRVVRNDPSRYPRF
ncbi:MAG: type II toxin-antitoxin system prevent-host-death family antitoxin, partial [bacterium]|nr:type II toxin-antitoxin system prevent-host-death family antitoxin [bacterium]